MALDLPNIPEKIIKPPVKEQKSELSKEILKTIFGNEGEIFDIIYPEDSIFGDKTKKEINKLNENLKQKFIENLKKTTNKEDIKQAIEKGTLKIFNIPGKNKISISLKGDNVDYIYNLDGSLYFNFVERRINMAKKAAFNGFTGIEEVNIDGINYITKDGKKYQVFTKEYYNILFKELENINDFINLLNKTDFDKL